MIKQDCSNCGARGIEYTEEEWKGREFTLCKKCNHPLTVTGGFLELCNDSVIQKQNERFKKMLYELKRTIRCSGRTNIITTNYIDSLFVKYNINLKDLEPEK